MDDYNNVECTRCGNRWYSRKFEEEGELPESCTTCYRDSVREIPPPPTIFDRIGEKIGYCKREIPKRAEERKHQAILWKENNQVLLSMMAMGTVFIAIISVIAYFLFR